MLVPHQKLNPKLFDADLERVPVRNGFGDGLVLAADADPRVVGLCADLTESTKMLAFREKYPKRFVEIGVAEQNLATVASGLAAVGKIPFITSYATFSPGRNWEQIRTTIAYNNRPVKIVGSHAGVSVGPDGGTHQALEDIAIMRALPRMVVVVPADAHEARKATLALPALDSPAYLRLTREKTPVITTKESPFVIGKANLLRSPKNPQVALIACGPLVHNALLAAEVLAKEGIEVSVLNNHTIKPMDEESVVRVAKEAGRVVTIEEHQVAGGMGSAVAEVLAQNHPVPIEFIGVHDQFGQSGKPEELLEHYGMGVQAIVAAAKKVLLR
ncbi:MAG: transketolase C-terminal domain-containing protein [Patescibacteria group bacterium]